MVADAWHAVKPKSIQDAWRKTLGTADTSVTEDADGKDDIPLAQLACQLGEQRQLDGQMNQQLSLHRKPAMTIYQRMLRWLGLMTKLCRP